MPKELSKRLKDLDINIHTLLEQERQKMEIKYISPIGELIYPHINREDPSYGRYKTILKLVLTKLKNSLSIVTSAKDEFRTTDGVNLPYTINPEVGTVEIKCNSKYPPQIVDDQAQPLVFEDAPEIYGGTKAKLKIKIRCVDVPPKKYVSAYLSAVQIIELASIPTGFEAVEGVSSAKEEQQSEPAASDFDKYQVNA